MNAKEEAFVFTNYKINKNGRKLYFAYKIRQGDGQELDFLETLTLPKKISSLLSQDLLDRVLKNLHLILGISYWKLYCPKKMITLYGLTGEEAEFWNTVYTKGLGEFFYRNKIDFRGLINFPYIINKPSVQPRRLDEAKKDRFLVGIGGGKDSIVAVELLKKQKKAIVGYVLKNKDTNFSVQKKVLKLMNIDYLLVEREIDKKLFALNKKPGSLNGHVPISAIYAFIGLFLAVVYGFSEVVAAQEKSANEGNIEYLGEVINHQWSKSEEFEQMFQRYIKRFVTSEVTTHSIMRKYSELEIIKEFVRYKKYLPVFSSCNRNFRINKKTNKLWCGQCPKCAFMFLCLASYLPKAQVMGIFGKNLLADRSLLSLYRDLLGLGKVKPFECVGTFAETTKALQMVEKKEEFKNDYVVKKLIDYENTRTEKI